MSPKQTMSIAQGLYEGVEIGQEGPTGLITYMRTDSTRISGEALSAVREYIKKSMAQITFRTNLTSTGKAKSRRTPTRQSGRPTSI
jgi:DNA topoisomerase-1